MSGTVCYLVVVERSSELAAWLRFNDVDPNDVPFKSDVFVESVDGDAWVVRFSVYVRSASGSLRYDAEVRDYLYEDRQVPLVNDPPMWWLERVEAAPTGGGAASCVSPVGAADAGCDVTVAEGACNAD